MNKNKDKFSVVMTFYNAQDFIMRAISSVGQQWTKDDEGNDFQIEFVMVDDKSPDNTRKIIEEYIERYKKEPEKCQDKKTPIDIEFRIVEPEHNLGCGGARKFGIESATGDYYAFLDADDYYINRNVLMTAYKAIKQYDADIVEMGIIYNQENGQKNISQVSSVQIYDNKVDRLVAQFANNTIKFNVWSKMYRRQVIETFPYSETRTFEDVRTTPIWVWNANRVVVLPDLCVNYRATGGSIIRKDPLKTRIDTITAISELFERFKDQYAVLKAMYARSMVDIKALCENKNSTDPGFNEMSRLNTYMLSYIYPNNYKQYVYNIEDEQKQKQEQEQEKQNEIKEEQKKEKKPADKKTSKKSKKK